MAECGLPDPIIVQYPGSDSAASLIAYIVCLNGQVPERYELWSLNSQEVCEVHPFAQVKLFDNFAEETLPSTYINLRRCRIPFIS